MMFFSAFTPTSSNWIKASCHSLPHLSVWNHHLSCFWSASMNLCRQARRRKVQWVQWCDDLLCDDRHFLQKCTRTQAPLWAQIKYSGHTWANISSDGCVLHVCVGVWYLHKLDANKCPYGLICALCAPLLFSQSVLSCQFNLVAEVRFSDVPSSKEQQQYLGTKALLNWVKLPVWQHVSEMKSSMAEMGHNQVAKLFEHMRGRCTHSLLWQPHIWGFGSTLLIFYTEKDKRAASASCCLEMETRRFERLPVCYVTPDMCMHSYKLIGFYDTKSYF